MKLPLKFNVMRLYSQKVSSEVHKHETRKGMRYILLVKSVELD